MEKKPELFISETISTLKGEPKSFGLRMKKQKTPTLLDPLPPSADFPIFKPQSDLFRPKSQKAFLENNSIDKGHIIEISESQSTLNSDSQHHTPNEEVPLKYINAYPPFKSAQSTFELHLNPVRPKKQVINLKDNSQKAQDNFYQSYLFQKRRVFPQEVLTIPNSSQEEDNFEAIPSNIDLLIETMNDEIQEKAKMLTKRNVTHTGNEKAQKKALVS